MAYIPYDIYKGDNMTEFKLIVYEKEICLENLIASI